DQRGDVIFHLFPRAEKVDARSPSGEGRNLNALNALRSLFTPIQEREKGASEIHNHLPRILGSSASRSASPNRLKPNTVTAAARMGMIAIDVPLVSNSSAPPSRSGPHAAVGSCTPRPR